MSKVIDEKVVSLQFDNKNFENNVKESMSTLDKLKRSLNFNKAAKSFDELTEASNKVSFKGIEKSMDKLESYMSVKTMAIFTVVSNMVTKIQNSFENMVKTFTVEPIRTGFNEYELKMGSVQTIMAATGADLATVNGYLEELNKYADKTIYSFSDMTTNIGKFTNAGVKLEDAVLAIKGISNEAALSGANAQEASRAMYNLAQSISMGYVQLIDWKSIENANMATQDFKENLAGVALEMGLIKKTSEGMYVANGKNYNLQQLFKDGLKDQWLTTDVLIKTLSNYADETTEVGQKAYAAAQDVKTFTMMMDTLKEAAQSGWAQTWELIVGDFEQAKKLFTYFSDVFGGIIEKAADVRNSIVQSTMETYWDKITRKVSEAGINVDAFEAQIIDSFKKAGVPIEEMIEKWGSLGNALAHMKGWADVIKKYVLDALNKLSGGITTVGDAADAIMQPLEKFQDLVNRTIRGEFGNGKKRIEELTNLGENAAVVQKLVNKVWEKNNHTWKDTTITQEELVSVMGELSDAELVAMGIDEDRIDSVRALVKAIEAGEGEIGDLFSKVTELRGRELLFESLKNIITAISQRVTILKEAWHEVFPVDMAALLDKINSAFYNLSRKLILNSDKADKLKRALKGVFSFFGIITDGLRALIRVLFPALDKGADMASNSLLDILATLGDGIVAFRELINNEDLFIGFMKNVVSMFVAGCAAIAEFVEYLWNLEEVQEVLHALGLYFADIITWWETLWDGFLADLADPALGIFGALKNAFKKIGNAIKTFLLNLPLISKAIEFIQSIPELIGEAGWNTIMGFVEGIWSGIQMIPKVMGEFVSLVINTVKDLLGIHSPSTVFQKIAYYVVAGFAEGITIFAKLIYKVLNWLITGVLNVISELKDRLITWWKNSALKGYVDGIAAWMKDTLDKIYAFLKPYIDIVSDLFSKFINKMKELDWNAILNWIVTLFKCLIIYKLVSGIESTGKGIEKFGRSLELFAKSLKNVSKSIKIAAVGVLLVGFAIALAAIIGIVYLLSKTDTGNLVGAVAAVAAIAIILGALIIVFSLMAMKGKDYLTNTIKATKDLAVALASFLLALAGAIVVMVLVVGIVEEMIDRNGVVKFQIALGFVMEIALMLLGFCVALIAISTIFKAQGSLLTGAGSAILGLAAGIFIICYTIEHFMFDESGVFDPAKAKGIKEGFNALLGMILTLGGILVAIGAVTKGGSSVKGIGASILAMSIALFLIVTAVMYWDWLSQSMKDPKGSLGAIIGIMAVLLLGMAAIGAGFKDVDPKAIKGIKGIMIVFLLQIVAVMALLAVIKNANFDSDATVIIGILGFLEAFLMTVVGYISTLAKDLLENHSAAEVEKFQAFIRSLMWSMVILIGAFSLSFLAIAGSLKLLDNTTLTDQHVGAILGMALALIGGIASLMWYLEKVNTSLPDPKRVLAIVAIISGFVVVMALSLGLIALSLGSLDNKDLDPDMIGPLVVSVIALVAAVGGLMVFLWKTAAGISNADQIMTTVLAIDSFVLALAASIGIIAFSLTLLNNISLNTNTMLALLIAEGLIILGAWALMSFISKNAQGIQNYETVKKIIESIDVFIGALSIAILIIAASIKIMDKVELNWFTIGAFGGSILAVLGAILLMMNFVKSMQGSQMTTAQIWAVLGGMSVFAFAFGIAICAIAQAVKQLHNITISERTMWTTIGLALTLLAGLGEVLLFLTKGDMVNAKWSNLLISLGGACVFVIAFALAIGIISDQILKINGINLKEETLVAIFGMMVIMLIGLGVLYAEAVKLPPDSKWKETIGLVIACGGAVGAISWLAVYLAEKLSAMENFDHEKWLWVVGGMIAALDGTYALVVLLEKFAGGSGQAIIYDAVAILIIAAAIGVLAYSLYQLSKTDVDKLNAAAIPLYIILILLDGLEALFLIFSRDANTAGSIARVTVAFAFLIAAVGVLAWGLGELAKNADGVIKIFEKLHDYFHEAWWNIFGEIENQYGKLKNGEYTVTGAAFALVFDKDFQNKVRKAQEEGLSQTEAMYAAFEEGMSEAKPTGNNGNDELVWDFDGPLTEEGVKSFFEKFGKKEAEEAGATYSEVQLESFENGFLSGAGDAMIVLGKESSKVYKDAAKKTIPKKGDIKDIQEEASSEWEDGILVASTGGISFGRETLNTVKKKAETELANGLVDYGKEKLTELYDNSGVKEKIESAAGEYMKTLGLGFTEGMTLDGEGADYTSMLKDWMSNGTIDPYQIDVSKYIPEDVAEGFNKVKGYLNLGGEGTGADTYTQYLTDFLQLDQNTANEVAEVTRDDLVQRMSDALEVYLGGESDLTGRIKSELLSSGKLKNNNTEELMSYIANETFKELDSQGIKFNEANKDKIAQLIMDTIIPNNFNVDGEKFRENVTNAINTATEGLAADNGLTGLWNGIVNGASVNACVQSTIEWPDLLQTNDVATQGAINGLKSEITALGIRIANLSVQLDSGVLVGQLTPKISESLGKQAILAGRVNFTNSFANGR